MDRRAFLCALGLLGVPAAVAAQPERRIAFLGPRTPSETLRFLEAFRQGLSDLGWVEARISTSSTGLQKARMSGYQTSRPNCSVSRSRS